MWVKNIAVTNVENKGFATSKYENSHPFVKRVTVEFDVHMLPKHDSIDDPMEVIQKSMDSEIWYLKQPVVEAVYNFFPKT